MDIKVEKHTRSGSASFVARSKACPLIFDPEDGMTLFEEGECGRIAIERSRGVMQVAIVSVSPAVRRKGIATKLYEQAAQTACEVYGAPLASDKADFRNALSNAFWRKQLAKGRATYRGKRDFKLTCPAPESLAGMSCVKKRRLKRRRR